MYKILLKSPVIKLGSHSSGLRYNFRSLSLLVTTTEPDIMELKSVVKKLNNFAPSTLAGSWDNVGLLVEPTPPHTVKSILLTNDLTEAVMKEALQKQVQLILSYHPPIFSALKRLTQRTWKERIVVQCIENRIAVYSPHTSYDAVLGGVNDWLLTPFEGTSKPLEKVYSTQYPTGAGYRLDVTVPDGLTEDMAQHVMSSLPGLNGVTLVSNIKSAENCPDGSRLSLNCTEEGLVRALKLANNIDGVKETVEVLQLVKPPIPEHGPGRIMTLASPLTLTTIVQRVKQHLGLSHLRLAKATGVTTDSVVKTIAVCAGSGSSVLHGVCADLYLTGEMSHHEVLDANHRRASVVLCDHSNTERGFLKLHRHTLQEMFGEKINVLVSETDRDPLDIV